jgi:hypothetical protein
MLQRNRPLVSPLLAAVLAHENHAESRRIDAVPPVRLAALIRYELVHDEIAIIYARTVAVDLLPREDELRVRRRRGEEQEMAVIA